MWIGIREASTIPPLPRRKTLGLTHLSLLFRFFFVLPPFSSLGYWYMHNLHCDLLETITLEDNLSGVLHTLYTMAHVLPDLAAQVSSAAAAINDFLVSNDHPQPSFNVGAPPAFPSAPTEILDARQQLLNAAQELVDLAVGPAEHLRWLACRVRCDYRLNFRGLYAQYS